MILRKKRSWGFLLLFCLGLLSCSQDREFTSYQILPAQGFGINPIVFELTDNQIDQTPHNLFIRLRNDNDYPYSNLFLICSLKAGGEIVLQDTLEYAMAAPDGTWLGTGFTEVKESKLWWKEGVVIPDIRPLIIEIAQAMRTPGTAEGLDALKGIVAVGISIEAKKE